MTPRILVAGLGNIFLGDDAFGCETVRLLAMQPVPEQVRVIDYGIRGFDLALALAEPYEAFILVDATPRGDAPGTLYAMELDGRTIASARPEDAAVEPHGMNPMKVLAAAQAMGARPQQVFVVGCEPSPETFETQERIGLSSPVQAALAEAMAMIRRLVDRILRQKGEEYEHFRQSSRDRGGHGGGAYDAA